MRSFRRTCPAAALAGVLAMLVTTDAPAAPVACAAADAAPGSRPATVLRGALRCTVNAERRGAGLGKLAHDAALTRAARRHARDMVVRGYFAHERPGWTFAGRLAAAGWTGSRAGEAIAWGCGTRATARATVRSWLDSPPHRAILLGPHARVGIGMRSGAPGNVGCGASAATWVLDAGS